MKITLLALLLFGLGACAAQPVDISCKGKIVLSGNGQISAVGFGGSNSFALSADCGDGAFFRQVKP